MNLRYGNEPGVLFYTHISDQYTPFYTKVIAANARGATHVLDGLLYPESDLRIEEHYTDTAGFTDHVFALCHLLGFRFVPRIRDLADKLLYAPGKERDHPTLSPLIGGKLNLKLVRTQWDDHSPRHSHGFPHHPQARQLPASKQPPHRASKSGASNGPYSSWSG